MKRKSQSLIALLLLGVLSVSLLTGCSASESESESYLIESDEESEDSEIVSESDTEPVEETESEDMTSEEAESEENTEEGEDLCGFVSSVDDDGILTLALASDGTSKAIEDYTALDRTLYSETGVSYDYDPVEADLVCLFTDGYFVEGSADEIIAGDFIVISTGLDEEQGELTTTLFVYPETEEASDQ